MTPQDTPSAPSVAASQTSQSEARRTSSEAEATPASSSHSLHGQQEEKIKAVGHYVLVGNTLGKGNFARVELATHSLTRAKVAVKVIHTDKIKEEYVRRNLFRESAIMRQLQHPNIVRLYETIKTSRMLCLVTDCAEGGELLQYVKNDCADRRLGEDEGRIFMRQLVSAMHYMHQKGIVHRDLKMENILLDKHKRKILIIDFGLSNKLEAGELLATHCGSPEYAAPELFVPGKVYGAEVDVWSLGVNMFAMLAGKLPFRVPRQGGNRRRRLLDQISFGIGAQQEAESSHFSQGAMDLVRLLLQPDSELRITLPKVMEHPWITKGGLYPLHPYIEQGYDHNTRDRIMDLMCARLDVTHSQIQQSVSESRCDWISAIYHLLHDQPDGLGHLRDISRQEACRLVHSHGQTTSQPTTGLQSSKQVKPRDSGEDQVDGAQVPSSINAVMRQLEAAAGKPLQQTRVGRRHSEGARPRPLVNIRTPQQSAQEGESSEKGLQLPASLSIQSGKASFRSRFSRSRRGSHDKSAEKDNSRESTIGSPIRSAMLDRGQTTELVRRLSADHGVVSSGKRFESTPSRQILHQTQRPSSAGGRFQRRASLDATSERRQLESSAEHSVGDDGDSTPKKKLSLKWRQSLKKQPSPAKEGSMKRPKSSDDIPSLVNSGRPQGVSSMGFVPSGGSSSLSRSFELKPRAMSAFAQHSLTLQPYHLSAYSHLAEGDLFSQPVPQYDLNMPWAGPIFTGYSGHSSGEHSRRPALQRTHRGNRARTSSMADALTAYPTAYLQAVPTAREHSEPAIGNGDVAHNAYQPALPVSAHYSSGDRPRRSSTGMIGGMLRRSFRIKSKR